MLRGGEEEHRRHRQDQQQGRRQREEYERLRRRREEERQEEEKLVRLCIGRNTKPDFVTIGLDETGFKITFRFSKIIFGGVPPGW